ADDVEQRGVGAAGDCERGRVGADRVGIRRGQRGDDGGVLGDRLGGGGRDHRGVIVDVGEVDGDGLGGGVGSVEGGNLDLIAVRVGLEVGGRLAHQGAADDVEQRGVGAAGDCERGRVGAARVGIRRGERVDDGGVLGDRLGGGGRDHRGVIVDVGEVDGDSLGGGVGSVEGGNLDLIAVRVGLEVGGG